MSTTLLDLPLDILKLLSENYCKKWKFILAHVNKKWHNLVRNFTAETSLIMLFMRFRNCDGLSDELVNWFPFQDKYLIHYGSWYSVYKKYNDNSWGYYTIDFNPTLSNKINITNENLIFHHSLAMTNPFAIYIHKLDEYGTYCNFWSF